MSEDLLFFAQLGYADQIKRLVADGVDPDWRREDGVTTLMMAAMTGRIEVMEALIEVGATVDLQTPDGTTALLAACTYARTTREIMGVEVLLARGANPSLANAEGNDALMMAARHGLVDAAVALIRAGADTRRANRFGTTALMQAARGHLVETCRMLIRAGADRAAKDERGLMAAQYARELGEPPPDLAAMLVPSDASAPSSRKACRFDREDFKLKLLGSWDEHARDGEFEYVEASRDRQILVYVTHLPAELDPDERHDAISRRVKEYMAALRDEAGEDVRFSEVRLAEAQDAIQARFNATRGNDLFVAVCVYAAPLKFVTLAYRDFRRNLSEESRGRQAGESVASFRVK
jgi:ankyrin repeat protein